MPDKEIVERHPFHPALVHFPIACWVLSHPADFVVIFNMDILIFNLDCWAVSSLLIWTGIISALPAMAFGVYDFMQLPDEDKLMETFYKHVGFVSTAWGLYLASGYIRLDDNMVLAPPGLLPALISIAGLICLCIGGWHGGRMVYKYHLGINVNG